MPAEDPEGRIVPGEHEVLPIPNVVQTVALQVLTQALGLRDELLLVGPPAKRSHKRRESLGVLLDKHRRVRGLGGIDLRRGHSVAVVRHEEGHSEVRVAERAITRGQRHLYRRSHGDFGAI